MWIFYAIAAQFSEALETATDKIAIVSNKKIDTLVATFLRIFFYMAIFGGVGASGVLGKMHIVWSMPIVILGVFCCGMSLCYTYFLKHIEATAASIFSYGAPFLYLLIDSFIVKAHLNHLQIFGIILMTFGGLMFVIDPKKLKFKKEMTVLVWLMLIYNFIIGAFENYGFKYYFSHYGVNEVSYGFSVWAISLWVLFLVVIFSGKTRALFAAVVGRPKFLGTLIISKTFDATQWWLYLHSLSLAAASQVSATSELYPLMLVIIIFVAQKVFRFKAEEKFTDGHLAFKFGAVALLFVGGILIR